MYQTKVIVPARDVQTTCVYGGERQRRYPFGFRTLPVFLFRGQAEVSQNFLVRLPNGKFVSPGFSHMPLERAEAPAVYPEMTQPNGGEYSEIDHPVALLSGGPHGEDSYWHWLIDYIPRLWVLEQAGVSGVPLLVNTRLSDIQMETLALYAPRAILMGKPKMLRYKCKDLIAPSFMAQTGVVYPEVPAFLRGAAQDIKGAGYKRVYLSRAGIKRRALDNEAEIERLMESSGFTVVRPHTLRFKDQVAALKDASLIVGPHGGSFANIVFAKPGATVIEIANNHWHTSICTLAASAGHTWRHVLLGPKMIDDIFGALDMRNAA